MHHWRGVAALGLEIAERTRGVNPYVAVLFAMFHDLERWDDGIDPGHGPRAASLVESIGAASLELAPPAFENLVAACRAHSKGLVSDDATIGACWDADRLTLWRVGGVPEARFLSTEAGRSHELFALGPCITRSPPTWSALRARLNLLLARGARADSVPIEGVLRLGRHGAP
jgi:uncharacterized protein